MVSRATGGAKLGAMLADEDEGVVKGMQAQRTGLHAHQQCTPCIASRAAPPLTSPPQQILASLVATPLAPPPKAAPNEAGRWCLGAVPQGLIVTWEKE